ncbi:MAG TPA: four helix bundle protein [Polyangiaceae bacterium]|nr:four helix bundle protein [Polyangiaceae bacterium]
MKEFESLLPHHRLIAYQAAGELLDAVRAARIREPRLRDQALRAAYSTCLNIAEGPGKSLAGERRRAFSIARGEAVEAVAAAEVAVRGGSARSETLAAVIRAGNRVYALLTGLMR